MSTRTAQGAIAINGHKIAAVIAQVGSFATTYLFIRALGLNGIPGFFIAVAAEFLLLAMKTLVFSSKHSADALGWAAVIFDTLLNAGGLWPYVQHLDKTPSWGMLVEGLGMAGELRKIPALVIALGIGYILSIAPHRLWRGA